MRMINLTANIQGKDLGNVGKMVERAVLRAGTPPRGVTVKVEGQVPILNDTFSHLFVGLALAVVVIFLMLSAYFQSPRLAITVLSTSPAIVCGVLFMLWITGTTLNVQSFMGAIMSIGVGVANAILLVAFAENNRLQGMSAEEAAKHGAGERLRPILMTSIAMVSGMVPMAMALGGGQMSAPLGRAVIGGLTFSTITALVILPVVFAAIQGGASIESPSLHPDDRGE
jgi:multidrug efflux pump subunit AcrB